MQARSILFHMIFVLNTKDGHINGNKTLLNINSLDIKQRITTQITIQNQGNKNLNYQQQKTHHIV
jgi:hypothetical protein